MKAHRATTPTTTDLRSQILAVLNTVNQQDARRYAAAIRGTMNRHRDGYMANATMKKHLGSLWGAVDAKGLRADVELLLASGGAL